MSCCQALWHFGYETHSADPELHCKQVIVRSCKGESCWHKRMASRPRLSVLVEA